MRRVSELRAVGDPVRLAVVGLLTADPEAAFSARELAERLGVPLTLMHYHLGVLCREELVAVEPGRRERRYRAAHTALRWEFPEPPATGGPDTSDGQVATRAREPA